MLLADMYRRRPFAPYPYSLVLVPTFVCLYPCLAGTVSHSSIDVDDSLQKILTLNCRLSPVNCIRVLSELFSCLGTLTHRLPSFCIADRQVTSELLPKKVAEHIPALFYVVYWHLISDRPSLVLSEVLGYVQTFLFEAFDRSCKGVSWFPIVLAMISQLRTLVDLRLLWVSGRRSVQHALNLSNGFEPDLQRAFCRKGPAQLAHMLSLRDSVKLQWSSIFVFGSSNDHFVYCLGLRSLYVGRGACRRVCLSSPGVVARVREQYRNWRILASHTKGVAQQPKRYELLLKSGSPKALYYLVLLTRSAHKASGVEAAFLSYMQPACNGLESLSSSRPCRHNITNIPTTCVSPRTRRNRHRKRKVSDVMDNVFSQHDALHDKSFDRLAPCPILQACLYAEIS